MKIYDLHIHRDDGKPKKFISQLEEAGVYGAAVFSKRPIMDGPSYKERIKDILDFCKDYPGRLFPVLFIHPYESGASDLAKDAVSRGIAGFKMICSDYYVSDPVCLELLRTIASLNKPVCFHSGILWDKNVSAQYNRPINWECLLTIPGLRFSLAHCSWPWYDECIALYGKFQNAYDTRPGAAEMFFDLTPGTPVPYRRDLLTKLHTVGYDVEHNILFGTDCRTDYRVEWSKQWQDIDNAIYDELKISKETRKQIYQDNFLRFFGVSGKKRKLAALTSDGSK